MEKGETLEFVCIELLIIDNHWVGERIGQLELCLIRDTFKWPTNQPTKKNGWRLMIGVVMVVVVANTPVLLQSIF